MTNTRGAMVPMRLSGRAVEQPRGFAARGAHGACLVRRAVGFSAVGTPPKKRTSGGRVTPKGQGDHRAGHRNATQVESEFESRRYTPPGERSEHLPPSPMWVPVLMFALLGIGSLIIVINYLGVLPGGTKQLYTFGGLGFILGGIITATQYR